MVNKLAKPKDILKGTSGEKLLLLGNEAIARGVLEAGVGVATTYPGTPSSEIADTLSGMASDAGYYFEYSANEKIAVEVAGSAAVAKIRSFVSMKHVGLNVAADPFMTLAYVGVRAGMIILSADDPSMWSSQNEQDNRYYSQLSGMPMVEASNPQEAKDFIIESYDFSEKLEMPILFRTTTRLNHTRAPVTLGPRREIQTVGDFEKDPSRFVPVPSVARKRHLVVLENLKKAEELSYKSKFNKLIGEGSIGIITSGVGFNYTMEALNLLNLDAEVLKLGLTNPLPKQMITEFLERHKKIFIVEELEPYLELHVRSIAKDVAPDVEIFGKYTNHIPRYYELNTRKVMEGLSSAFHIDLPFDFKKVDDLYSTISKELPPRPPVLCAGCPHRATFYEIRKATFYKGIYPSDIGCYTLAIQDPLHMADILFCMGSSVSTAAGLSKVTDKPVVAAIGDSTFFHSGIPALASAVYNKHHFTLAILDNRTTAMTGHQPHPGIGITGMREEGEKIDIESVVRGVGVKNVVKINPFEVRKSINAIRAATRAEGVSVVISEAPCALVDVAQKRKKGEKITPYVVDPELCIGCKICIDQLGCPAIYWNESTVKAEVDITQCTGCSVCAQICPKDAFKLKED